MDPNLIFSARKEAWENHAMGGGPTDANAMLNC